MIAGTSLRMEEIAAQVSPASVVADIGTDHGIIPALLLESGRAKYVIATDISEPSLDKARTLFRMRRLSEKTDCRAGDGLLVLRPYEADCLIISGMGGLLIAAIIEQGMRVAKSAHSLILQPNTAQPELREFLFTKGFVAEKEILCEEHGKFYEIIVASWGKPRVLRDHYLVSPLWEKNDVYHRYMAQKKLRAMTALQGLLSAKEPDEEKIAAARAQYDFYAASAGSET